MMSLNIHVENHGKRTTIIFVLTVLKREIKEDIVFVMRAKAQIQNAFQKRNLFD